MKGGEKAFIRTGFWCNRPGNLAIGKRGTICINCQFYADTSITIGNDFLIGSDVIIQTSEHNFDKQDMPIIEQGSRYRPVMIGNNVYIGARVIILPGVIIEDNIIVGAGSIVTKRLYSGYIYGGIPAKKLREIDAK